MTRGRSLPDDVDARLAAALGFPKAEYTAVERERRWLAREVPRERIVRTEAIRDLYVTGTRLRLREARPIDGGPPMLRLTRKVDLDHRTRLITSIYLPEHELAVLEAALPGARIEKLRHRLGREAGVALLVDEFQGPLAGLVLVEADFDGAERMASFAAPDFALREVTDDARYGGGHLALHGRPSDAP